MLQTTNRQSYPCLAVTTVARARAPAVPIDPTGNSDAAVTWAGGRARLVVAPSPSTARVAVRAPPPVEWIVLVASQASARKAIDGWRAAATTAIDDAGSIAHNKLS
jgi:hypothetical protein